jgi:hypothetical protein
METYFRTYEVRHCSFHNKAFRNTKFVSLFTSWNFYKREFYHIASNYRIIMKLKAKQVIVADKALKYSLIV